MCYFKKIEQIFNFIKYFTILLNLMRAPKKLVMDNQPGFTLCLFRDFLEKDNGSYHFTTSYRRNSDVERFQSSLNENIRILKKKKKSWM